MISYYLLAYKSGEGQVAVWCPECGELHFHGDIAGFRCAHCRYPYSAYKLRQYFVCPCNKPLPKGALKYSERGQRRLSRWLSFGRQRGKKYKPLPPPEWAITVEDVLGPEKSAGSLMRPNFKQVES